MKLPSLSAPVLFLLACIPCCLALLGLGGVAALLGGAIGASILGLPIVAIVLAIVALILAIAVRSDRRDKPSCQPIEFIE